MGGVGKRMEEAGGVMRAGRGTNCLGEGDRCTDSSRKRSLQLLTPRRIPTRPEVKALRGSRLEGRDEGGKEIRKQARRERRIGRSEF